MNIRSAAFVDPSQLKMTQPTRPGGKPHVTAVQTDHAVQPVLNLNTVQGRNTLKSAVREQESVFVRVARTQVLRLDLSSPTTRRQVVKDISTLLNAPHSGLDLKVKAGLLRVYQTLTTRSTGNFHEQLKPYAQLENLHAKVGSLTAQFHELMPQSQSASLRHLLRDAVLLPAIRDSALISAAVKDHPVRFEGLTPESAARLCSGLGVSVPQLEEGIKQIGAKIQQRLGDRSYIFIKDPVGLLQDYFQRGFAFEGAPKVTGFRQVGPVALPQIEWTQGPNTGKAPVEVPASRIRNGQDALEVLRHFQQTIPCRFGDDGCDARCNYMADVMEKTMGLTVGKIKLCTKDNKNFSAPDQSLFPAAAAKWNMHTAPFVVDEQGQAWIIDPAIHAGKPVKLQEWEAALSHGHACESTLCKGADTYVERMGKTSAVEMPKVLDDLAALHLFQVVDNNSGRTWGTWKFDSGSVSLASSSAPKSSEPRVIIGLGSGGLEVKTYSQSNLEAMMKIGRIKLHNGVYCLSKLHDQISQMSSSDFEGLKKHYEDT